MLIVFCFGLLLPLILLVLASSIICFIIGRPRIALFFVFLALNLLRQFTFFTYEAYGEPVSNSWTYFLLSSGAGYGITWGGMFISMVLAYWDFWHNLGGIKGAKAYTEKARAAHKALKNSSKSKGQQKEKDKEGDNI
jgi:hypothetical protein